MLEKFDTAIVTQVFFIGYIIILIGIEDQMRRIDFRRLAHLLFVLGVVGGACIAFFTLSIAFLGEEFTFLALRFQIVSLIISGTTFTTGRVNPPTLTGTADVVLVFF